jgi:two-component system phosphate regulon sensor histidine kinase PhoR
MPNDALPEDTTNTTPEDRLPAALRQLRHGPRALPRKPGTLPTEREPNVHERIAALEAANAALCRELEMKTAWESQQEDFLAMLAHDLRNSLSVIVGYAQLLLVSSHERLTTDETNFLHRMESNALTAHALITKGLRPSSLRTPRGSFPKTPVDLRRVLQGVIQQYEAEARRRRLALDYQGEALPAVAGDRYALERVFTNLLTNALKFTPAGGRVVMHAAHRQDTIVVTIMDTGPGLAPAECATVFERYQRGSAAQHTEGTGLVLFIVKTLVEAHGGRVEVQSSLGHGACFRVILPVATS